MVILQVDMSAENPDTRLQRSSYLKYITLNFKYYKRYAPLKKISARIGKRVPCFGRFFKIQKYK